MTAVSTVDIHILNQTVASGALDIGYQRQEICAAFGAE